MARLEKKKENGEEQEPEGELVWAAGFLSSAYRVCNCARNQRTSQCITHNLPGEFAFRPNKRFHDGHDYGDYDCDNSRWPKSEHSSR